jgi:hypothetical protein
VRVDVGDHFEAVVDETVTGGFRTSIGTAPCWALSGKDTDPLIAELLVSTEEVTNLATTSADITSGNISISTNVARELLHERIAESSDFVIGATFRVEVGATLGTTHVDTSEGILEDLLKSEELEDRQVDGRVKTETALVRAKSRVKLHTVATVYVGLSLIVFPNNAELDDTLWDLNDLKCTFVFGMFCEERSDGDRELIASLFEFGFGGEDHDDVSTTM